MELSLFLFQLDRVVENQNQQMQSMNNMFYIGIALNILVAVLLAAIFIGYYYSPRQPYSGMGNGSRACTPWKLDL